MRRSFSCAAINGNNVSDEEALTLAINMSKIDNANIACAKASSDAEMRAARLSRFENHTTLKSNSTRSGRLAVEAQKASARRPDPEVFSRQHFSMANSCLYEAVGKKLKCDAMTLKFLSMSYIRTHMNEFHGMSVTEVDMLENGTLQSDQNVIKALAAVTSHRIQINGGGWGDSRPIGVGSHPLIEVRYLGGEFGGHFYT